MVAVAEPVRVRSRRRLPEALRRRFEAVILDWDGTAVPDRGADARIVRRLVEEACRLGMDVAVVSGTHVGNVDGQLAARPSGPGRLLLCLNRGSEVLAVDGTGPRSLHRHTATAEEEASLTAAAQGAVRRLAERGLRAEVVSSRLNRRKIDLIPLAEWQDPPKARIAQLLSAVEERLKACGIASLRDVVDLVRSAASEAGLASARVTSDVKHVEVGLTDKSDSARWLFDDLWRHGIAPDAVLVAGDEMGSLGGLPGSDSLMLCDEGRGVTALSVGVEPAGVPPGVLHLPGGPSQFLRVLRDQVVRRRRGELPALATDPSWSLHIEGVDPELERVHEALLTIADGLVGSNGAPLVRHRAAAPTVLMSGVYSGEGSATRLLPCPVWNRLGGDEATAATGSRHLDLHAGLVRHELDGTAPAAAIAFLARSHPGVAVLRALGPPGRFRETPQLASAEDAPVEAGTAPGGLCWMRSRGDGGDVVALAADDHVTQTGGDRLDRVVAYSVAADITGLSLGLEAVRRAGFEALLVEQRTEWARRWQDADITIAGDPDLQLAVRVALFQLMASVADRDEAVVGARGLTGPAYLGHVFWDTDVFVLPFLAATHPPSARAILEYRVRRLPQALAAARAEGREGARFPWESAGSGEDVTPTVGSDRAGARVAIRTGQLEAHIVADIAWAVSRYLDWTGDAEFGTGEGLRLVVETARYWAARIELDAAGRGHIRGVIGPDEYHVKVDDNAFTNVMARWNLRAAARLAGGQIDATERRRWHELADGIVDGYDPGSGLYEQFSGFFALEQRPIAELVPRRPVAATMLLGEERVAASQVVKQADVLMLHDMVPEETAPGSLVPNLAYYEPRTAHGSSLSPAVHASLMARAGQVDDAAGLLRLAARLDLDDLTGTTAGGLHLATMGGVWQALVQGFLGVAVHGDTLCVDPHLPREWTACSARLRFRGSAVRVSVEEETVKVEASPAVQLKVGDQEARIVTEAAVALPGQRTEGAR